MIFRAWSVLLFWSVFSLACLFSVLLVFLLSRLRLFPSSVLSLGPGLGWIVLNFILISASVLRLSLVVVVESVLMVLSRHVFKEGKDLASFHSLCCQKKVSGGSFCTKYISRLLLLGLLACLPLPGGSVPACTTGRSDHTTSIHLSFSGFLSPSSSLIFMKSEFFFLPKRNV